MIEVNKKYGCMTVLDNGEEYRRSEVYREALKELDSIEPYRKMGSYEHQDLMLRIQPHYKCKCICGRIQYFNEKTLLKNPKYCYYPISIADNQFNYSIEAQMKTRRKEEKYEGLENIKLWSKPPAGRPSYYYLLSESEPIDYSLPSEDYCERYNKYKTRQLLKKEKEYKETVDNLTRVYAKNYDYDFVGRQYDSLYIESCTNEHLESKPYFSYKQALRGCKRKVWHNITVYKEYRCKCLLCGKEQLVTCDKFGIYPPTEYGYHAYNGYWSEVYCKCHELSSFQWIVNKILFENEVDYKVEVSFSDLLGVSERVRLRFDFAVYNNDGSIKCLIECQGEQHFKPVEEFGGEPAFIVQLQNDNKKREYVKKNNIPLIELSYKHKTYDDICNILKNNNVI